MTKTRFEWDAKKDQENQDKHGVAFGMAQFAFADPNRVIAPKIFRTVRARRGTTASDASKKESLL